MAPFSVGDTVVVAAGTYSRGRFENQAGNIISFSRNGNSCTLLIVGTLTGWVRVDRLRHHNGRSVSLHGQISALLSRLGAPDPQQTPLALDLLTEQFSRIGLDPQETPLAPVRMALISAAPLSPAGVAMAVAVAADIAQEPSLLFGGECADNSSISGGGGSSSSNEGYHCGNIAVVSGGGVRADSSIASGGSSSISAGSGGSSSNDGDHRGNIAVGDGGGGGGNGGDTGGGGGGGGRGGSSGNLVEEYRCPICYALMCDPVIIASGNSFCRQCIDEWFRVGRVTCPIYNTALESTSLTPNTTLRRVINIYRDKHGIPDDIPPPIPSAAANAPVQAAPPQGDMQVAPAPVNAVQALPHSPTGPQCIVCDSVTHLRGACPCNATVCFAHLVEHYRTCPQWLQSNQIE